MTSIDNDIKFMTRAVELAKKGIGKTSPNPMVGAVIVKNNKIIGEGYHERCGEGHAEVNAFADAEKRGENTDGSTMYVTLEPCSHFGKTPPCADLIIKKKIKRAVIAMTDPNPLVAGRGIQKLRDAGINVTVGICEEECTRLNEIFIKYITTNRPFVLYKSAMTLDGKTASYSGLSKWISCEQSRHECQLLRNNMKAIMTGVNTVIADDPMLTCRIDGGRNPVRIILDSNMRIPLDSNIVQTAHDVPTILAVCKANGNYNTLVNAGIEIMKVPNFWGSVDLEILMSMLGERGIDSIMLEGGGTLAFSAFSAGIIDKVRIYIAPSILGGTGAKTPVEGLGFASPASAVKLRDMTCRMCGCDMVVEGYPYRDKGDAE